MGKLRVRSGAAAFEAYHRELYGDRWAELCRVMAEKGPQISLGRLEHFPQYSIETGTWRGLSGKADYWLDPASCWAASLLPISEGHHVWDMCAAPGGKMLNLALRLPPQADLLASEISQTRFQRLRRQWALLPPDVQGQLRILRKDACLLGLDRCLSMDRILLDAPCSSERYFCQRRDLLRTWSEARVRNTSRMQRALLCTALDCLAPGGILLYVTCSINPAENELLVAECLRKRPKRGFEHRLLEGGEADGFWQLEARPLGYHLLPDRNGGAGPLYLCLLEAEREPVGENFGL